MLKDLFLNLQYHRVIWFTPWPRIVQKSGQAHGDAYFCVPRREQFGIEQWGLAAYRIDHGLRALTQVGTQFWQNT